MTNAITIAVLASLLIVGGLVRSFRSSWNSGWQMVAWGCFSLTVSVGIILSKMGK